MNKPVRVLYVCRKFPLTSQTFVVDEIIALGRAGFTVDILAERIVTRELQRFPQLSPGLFIGMPRRATRSTPLLDASCFLTNRLPLSLKYRLFRRANHHAAIVAHFGWSVVRAAALKRSLHSRARLIGVFHGYDMSKGGARESLAPYRRFADEIDVFMPISALWAARLREAGIASDRIVPSRLGIDPEKVAELAGSDPPRRGARPFRLVSVGRLVAKKGFDVLISALGRLGPDFVREHFRLEIIGEGRRRRELEALVERLGLAGLVVLSGEHDRPEVLRRIRQADLFVLASRTAANGDMEGLPVVLMEAMALRVPVISTTHSGIPELIEDGRTGRLVGEGDEAALAEALAAFAADPAAFDPFVEPAYERLRKEFPATKHMADLIVAIDPDRLA